MKHAGGILASKWHKSRSEVNPTLFSASNCVHHVAVQAEKIHITACLAFSSNQSTELFQVVQRLRVPIVGEGQPEALKDLL